MNLATMLQPYSIEEFLDGSCGRKFCHVPGPPDKFAELLPWPRLNAMLQEHRWDYPRIRVAMGGSFPPVEEYIRYQVGATGQRVPRLDPVKLNGLLRQGATVILDAVDEISEPIRRLAQSMERQLREIVQVNAYASWGTSPGFGLDPHLDDHDVVIAQLAGRKRWLIYGPAPEASVSGDAASGSEAGRAAPAVDEPIWDHVLEAGELLYLPRHWWHAVAPQSEPTLHLTFGFRNRTGKDFLTWLQQELRSLPQFNRDLPRYAPPEARAAHMAGLREALLAAWDDQALERFLTLQDGVALARPRYSLPWSAAPEALPPEDEAVVQWTAPRAVLRGGAGSAVIEVWANGERWQFARTAEAVLHPLMDGASHSIDELASRAAGTLDRGHVRSFLTELLLQGLVSVVPVDD